MQIASIERHRYYAIIKVSYGRTEFYSPRQGGQKTKVFLRVHRDLLETILPNSYGVRTGHSVPDATSKERAYE